MGTGSAAAGTLPHRAAPKLLGLELLRFACALAVLIFHFQHFAMIGDGSGMARAHQPLAGLLWPVYAFGNFGVQIFWCISGFIFYWKYADPIAARAVSARRFFWLRFSRLYPLHLVTLLGVAALQPAYAALSGHWLVYDNGIASFVLQLGLADQWFGVRAMSFNGPVWSVSAELFVYVLFFLLMRAFGRRWWLIVAAIGVGLGGIWTGGSSAPVVCAGYFFAGGAAAEWLASNRARTHPAESRWLAAAIAAAALAIAAAFGPLTPDGPALPTLLLLLCPPVLFLLAQDMPLLDRWHAPIQAAGNLTYATYLIHFPMQLAFATVALRAGWDIPIDRWWFLAAYLAAVIVAGRLVFLTFEAPAQDFIRAVTLARPRTRATA